MTVGVTGAFWLGFGLYKTVEIKIIHHRNLFPHDRVGGIEV